jgi:hypothetical protein
MNLVLYQEATESLWSKIMAAAIRGPRLMIGYSWSPLH